jgi:ribose-phosphate pyrophosphokinase
MSGAVRLRRLFDLVGETKEPVAAILGEHVRSGEPGRFEVLVARLSSWGSEVDAVYGGMVWR